MKHPRGGSVNSWRELSARGNYRATRSAPIHGFDDARVNGRSLIREVEKHTGVAEGVGLHTFEIQELCHAFVVRLEQLLVDAVIDRCSIDDCEAVRCEEVDFEGQREHALYAEISGGLDEPSEYPRTDAPTAAFRPDRQSADLGEIFPEDV